MIRATTVAAIGLVGAGLITFAQALGIIFWGTTSLDYALDLRAETSREWEFRY